MESNYRGMTTEGRITTWWERRSTLQKLAVIGVPVLLIGAIIVAVVLATAYSGVENNHVNCNDRCKTIAVSFIEGMDTSVDPCQDFYQFTCGNWVSSLSKNLNSTAAFLPLEVNVIKTLYEALESKMTEDNLPSVEKKLVDFYASCVNNDIDEVLAQDILEEVAGFPFCEMYWRESIYDLNVGIANAVRKFGAAPLLHISVAPNWMNTSRNVLAVSAPEETDLKSVIEPNVAEVLKSLSELFPKFCFKRFLNHTDDIQALGKHLEIISANSQKIPQTKNFRLFKLKDLEKAFSGIDFATIFQLVTYDYLEKMDKVITADDLVAIYDYQYVKEFDKLLKSNTFSPSAFAIYLGLKTLKEMFPVDVGAKFSETMDKNETKNFRIQKSMLCLKSLSASLVYIIDRIYIEQIGAASRNKDKELEMIDYIRLAFQTLANQSDWIDPTTLSGVMDKLHAMRKLVGYPPWILDDEKLNSYYSDLPNMDSCYTTNIKRIVNFRIENEIKQLYEVNNLEEEINLPDVSTTTVNAFYNPLNNAIYFPLGIQDTPFYYENMPWYLNFGAIGAVIGHEITHGFDSEGRYSDKNGNIREWWSSQAKKSFDARSKCFVDQYNSYFDQQTGLSVNGTQTLAENIADNGGIRQAYLAYQNWVEKYGKEETLPGLENYSSNQLLFIAYGHMWCAKFDKELMTDMMKTDEHSQVPYRVWGAVSNSKEFAQTFNCKEGSKMNPKDKCVIW